MVGQAAGAAAVLADIAQHQPGDLGAAGVAASEGAEEIGGGVGHLDECDDTILVQLKAVTT